MNTRISTTTSNKNLQTLNQTRINQIKKYQTYIHPLSPTHNGPLPPVVGASSFSHGLAESNLYARSVIGMTKRSTVSHLSSCHTDQQSHFGNASWHVMCYADLEAICVSPILGIRIWNLDRLHGRLQRSHLRRSPLWETQNGLIRFNSNAKNPLWMILGYSVIPTTKTKNMAGKTPLEIAS
jgi:hypothetical protein